MKSIHGNDLSCSARYWALKLTERPSVTGTADEASFGPWLAEELRAQPVFAAAEISTLPVGAEDEPYCVLMLLRGTGRETVILTGHYDTVTVDDYGDLRELATQPRPLLDALRARLEKSAETAAEQRARVDFSGDDYLPGRGLLDMKSGLAAGLAVAEAFAAAGDRRGNILFAAVPDEENNSSGARRLAAALGDIAREWDIEPIAAINLDAIADDEDGSRGRIIATGTVGKLLPTAFVAGLATHSGFPFNGVSAAAIVSAIATRMEWAPELTDDSPAQKGTPPSLLSMRDGKTAYDVTTPASAFATWNVLSLTRSPQDVLAAFEAICEEAAARCLADLRAKAQAFGNDNAECLKIDRISVYRYEQVMAGLQDGEAELSAFARDLSASSLPLPEQCRQLTERLWSMSPLRGPAIVIGFGSMPYLPTQLSKSAAARRLADIVSATAVASHERYGEVIGTTAYFAGISDMSFLGEADESVIGLVARNTPVWENSIRWPLGRAIAGVPTVNFGPWGRDYHTPLERLHVGYAFDTLPRVLADITAALLEHDGR